MSDETQPRVMTPEVAPRARPRFRKFAIAAFVVLIPIALFALWDYVEARRLGAAVKSLREAKQPLTTQFSYSDTTRPDNAVRYYDAASALVDLSDTYGPTGLLQRLDRGEAGSPELIAAVRAILERNREAESLLERATELEFYGMRPGFSYNYQWDRLMNLSRLADLRAYERLSARDADGAGLALIRSLRLVRPLNWNARAQSIEPMSTWSSTAAHRAMRTLPEVLQLRPSDEMLEVLRQRIGTLDLDDAIEQSVKMERALLVQTFWDESHQWYARPWRNVVPQPFWQLLRPWLAHRVVNLIAFHNRAEATARRPWPQRLDVHGTEPPPVRPGFLGTLRAEYSEEVTRYFHSQRVSSIGRRLALTRSALTLMAIEQYRRANAGVAPARLSSLVPQYLNAVPVDPYSGQELRYRSEPDRVVVYSVGVNRKDDGGEKLGEGPSRRWSVYRRDEPTPDIGLMMRLSGGSY